MNVESIKAKIEASIERITESGCWIWMRSTRGPLEYGQITLDDRYQTGAHRVAYEVFVGPIPDGKMVCHTCDVPSCCNPAHLFVGSGKDNAQDAVRKGRWNPGRVGGKPKLTNEQRRQIAAMKGNGMLQRDIGEMFGITQVRVSQIMRKQWAS